MTSSLPLLVLGDEGQIGFEAMRSLAPFGVPLGAGRRPGAQWQVDLAEPGAAERCIATLRPALVVNAAAYTAVDRAEAEPEQAERINHHAVAEIAAACRRVGAWLVHFSTDYVFDGRRRQPYREDDPAHPLSVYGASKWRGEEAVRDQLPGAHWVVRTQWIYAARGHNFLRTMLRLAGERQELRVVDDQYGAPTPARWVAASIAAMWAQVRDDAERRAASAGTYHLSAAGQTHWLGFAERIFAVAQARGRLPAPPRVGAISTASYAAPAPRPAQGLLDCQRLADRFGIRLPDWRIGLDQVMAELSSGPC